MPKYFRNVVRLEVLSQDEPISDSLSLEDIYYEITEGHCSGARLSSTVTELSAKEAARALIRQGSDPEFFGLDSKGNPIDAEQE